MEGDEADSDSLVVLGALRLARMLPLLAVIETPFLEAVDEITRVYGEGRPGVPSAAIEAITDWRFKAGNMEDSLSMKYFQSTGGGVALAVAGEAFIANRASVIQYSPTNFWKACDNIVHLVNGYQMPELRKLRTTLEGVEHIWQDDDQKCLERMRDSKICFDVQIRKIQAMSERRMAVARAIARCADW
ncbi:hypothetical protein ACN3XK_72455 [Actinomadura welshii]